MKKILILLILATTGLQAQSFNFECEEEITSTDTKISFITQAGPKIEGSHTFYSDDLTEEGLIEVVITGGMRIKSNRSERPWVTKTYYNYKVLAMTADASSFFVKVRIKDQTQLPPDTGITSLGYLINIGY